MTIKTLTFFTFLTCLLIGCSTKEEIRNFDAEQWKADKRGCLGKRKNLVQPILAVRDSLKGMDDDVLVDLLGKPEKTFYFSRGKKSYEYFIEPGSQCDPGKYKSEGNRIVFEINAIGNVSLIVIKKI